MPELMPAAKLKQEVGDYATEKKRPRARRVSAAHGGEMGENGEDQRGEDRAPEEDQGEEELEDTDRDNDKGGADEQEADTVEASRKERKRERRNTAPLKSLKGAKGAKGAKNGKEGVEAPTPARSIAAHGLPLGSLAEGRGGFELRSLDGVLQRRQPS